MSLMQSTYWALCFIQSYCGIQGWHITNVR